jgi:hypothetical protein
LARPARALIDEDQAMQIGPPEPPTSHQGTGNGVDPRAQAFPGLPARGQRARDRQFIQVFLSHKQKDHSAATAIGGVLRANSAGRIEVFMAEEIEKGADWQQTIERQLYNSDWFLLIFTGVEEDDWSWCHHEAGVFCGMMYPDANRVVVLYPPKVTLPDPLKKYQAVKCETTADGKSEDLDRFFKVAFGEEPYPNFRPINRYFAYEDGDGRREAASKIVQAMGRLVVESIVPETTMVVQAPNARLLDGSGFPEGTRIRRGSPAMRLFELGDIGFHWREFQDRLEPDFQKVLADSFWPPIYQACARSVRSGQLASTHALLRSPADQRHYAPIITRVDLAGDHSATFTITFVQAAAGTQQDVRHKSVARIFTALNLSHRFRWEIIDPYKDPDRLQDFVEHRARPLQRGGSGSAGNGAPGLTTIWEAISLLEVESRNRGVNDPDALPGDFGPSARVRVRAMFDDWAVMRERLQEAARVGDVPGFAAVLSELDAVNVEFISLAAKRLGELVRADADQSER